MNKPWLSSAYRQYLQTDEWQTVRKAALMRAGDQCVRCPQTMGLHVHHRTYIRLGHEHPDDLTVLCEECHDREHRRLDWERRVDAVASKRYGDDWEDRYDVHQIHDEVSDWLQEQEW